ncbi:hypothetical protein QQS21_012162 [Conoideocrella luteorostrata]|uniref:Uncharacterized protein n=1 Tax=Conoideocrella luteorostrata TaxID=1105319 RepID=A0AAJ0CG80_9HYPO|nr:hypothetical protein QQS21_012162 [Conoideocrella luteorostrata]
MNSNPERDLAREQRLRRYSGSRSVSRQHVSPNRNQEHNPDLSSSPSPGYVLEWSSVHSHAPQHRHILSSIEELRTEILAGESRSGEGRSLVLRTGRIDAVVRDTLQSVAGVDADFIDAHVDGKPYRPRTRVGRPRWWCWKYPEVAAGTAGTGPSAYRPGKGQVLTISRASLWMGSDMPILFIGQNRVLEHPHPREHRAAPKLKHQNAVTAMSQLASYGATGSYTMPISSSSSSSPRRSEMSSFEEDLWETLVSLGGASDTSLEEIFGELIYDRWVDCLAAMRLETHHWELEQSSFWRVMASLEINLDEAKYMSRRGKQLDVVAVSAWGDLIQRLQLRIQLRQPTIHAELQRQQHRALSKPETDNDRSLDRVAYLGGLSLPLMVVASILAIEGDYGPEGGNFWVFWVASFVASVLTVLIIYADQLRSAEVWLEIGDFDDEDELAEEAEEERRFSSRYLVQKWADGSRGKTWKKKELGWGGAVKKMSGWYTWRADPRLAFRRPGEVLRPKF